MYVSARAPRARRMLRTTRTDCAIITIVVAIILTWALLALIRLPLGARVMARRCVALTIELDLAA